MTGLNLYSVLKENFPGVELDSILDRADSNNIFNINTISLDTPIAASIKLNKEPDIKRLIKLAIEKDFIIQPIGSGKNWGYGSFYRNESRPIVVLDLSQMNSITEVDKELGLIKLGPGVTQQQLCDYLDQNGWHYMCPTTGAGPSVSVLANAIERGYGLTPHTDHFMAVNSLRGIIPNPKLWGDDEEDFIYKSAIASLDLSEEGFVDNTFKWGLGPYVEGVFTQSSNAIVTEGTIRLAKRPQGFLSFVIKVQSDHKLDSALAFIRNSLGEFEGAIPAINLMDKRRFIAMNGENPNGAVGQKLLSDEQISRFTKDNLLAEWMVVGTVYGNKDVVKAVRKHLKKSAKKVGFILFTDSILIKAGTQLTKLFPFGKIKTLKHNIENLKESNELMLGTPKQMALPLAYWRNSKTEPNLDRNLNPAKDGCGLLWYAPLVPMKKESIKSFVEFVRKTCLKHKVEPFITLTVLHHDCADSTIPILYDKDDPDSVKNAFACNEELFEEGRKLGFVPYRMSVQQQMDKLNPDHIHWKVCAEIKKALDPYNILTPTRYNPVPNKS